MSTMNRDSTEMAANRAQRFQSSVASILTKRPAQVHFLGAPGRIRTSDTRFRKPMLYPLSYGSKPLRSCARPPEVNDSATCVVEHPSN